MGVALHSAYWIVSRRMTVVADKVCPPKNIGDGSQLT